MNNITTTAKHFSYHKSIVSGQLFLKQHHFPKRNKKGRKFREESRRKANRLAFAISKKKIEIKGPPEQLTSY